MKRETIRDVVYKWDDSHDACQHAPNTWVLDCLQCLVERLVAADEGVSKPHVGEPAQWGCQCEVEPQHDTVTRWNQKCELHGDA